MKYKVGDKVKIKSLDWYNDNRDYYGNVECGFYYFIEEMSKYCGKILTIDDVYHNVYELQEDENFIWTDEMFECLVEESKNKICIREYLKERNIPETSLEANSIQEGYNLAIERVCQFLDSELYTSYDFFGNVEISSKETICKKDFIERLRKELTEK